MGEAKRRGTFEQRKAEGELKTARDKAYEEKMRYLRQRRRGKSVMPLFGAMMASMM